MAVTFAGGAVVNGSGGPARPAEVTVDAGRIVAVAPPGQASRRMAPDGGSVRDIRGLVLAPGFVDMHAHSDLALLTDPWHEAKVTQGVTLEVVGQDGLSYAPADEAVLAQLRRQLAGWNGEPEVLDRPWRTVAEYLRLLDRGAPVNAAYLAPHGVVRMLVVGAEDRPATTGELRRMCRIVDAAMRDGAMGLSAGLTYAPGMYADTADLMSHPAHTAGSDGILAGARPHPRAWGTFARYLGHYARDRGILRLETAVAHMTGSPARRLRLADRGRVAVGHAADLVCFDPDTIADTATYQAPRQRCRGVRHVMVNGEFVLDDGELTGRRPGRAIRGRGGAASRPDTVTGSSHGGPPSPCNAAVTAAVEPATTASRQVALTLGESHDESPPAGR